MCTSPSGSGDRGLAAEQSGGAVAVVAAPDPAARVLPLAPQLRRPLLKRPASCACFHRVPALLRLQTCTAAAVLTPQVGPYVREPAVQLPLIVSICSDAEYQSPFDAAGGGVARQPLRALAPPPWLTVCCVG